MEQISDRDFNKIREYLKENYGINLNNDKKGLVYSRLRSRVLSMNMTFSQYYTYLVNDTEGVEKRFFASAMTTNHTFFMREPDHFDYLQNTVLPWLEEVVRDKDVRLWCAASSSGEEPYTLQIILYDYFKNKPGWETSILATDISEKVLNKAVHGVYPNASVAVMPAHWRNNYFKKFNADHMQVVDEIRKLVTYRKFNLMDEKFPFKKPFHVIFCRNVMIYFDAPTQRALAKRFYDHMMGGGYLFIGHAESLGHANTDFTYVMPSTYRKPEPVTQVRR